MKAPPRVAVATSGGHDSTALLHCTLAQARPLGIEVWALHVNHGLLAAADDWQRQVEKLARRWGARFACERLPGQPARGDSVEAWARQGRYAALSRMAQDAACPIVLLAQHRRDQAETFVLQALRGAGAAGLSAMPQRAERDGLLWHRPWLHQPREAIEAYVRRHRLRVVDDPSNQDPRFARGRLRQSVWPALTAAFPQADTVLAMAARHAQAAQALADEAAALDAPAVLDGERLHLVTWRQLPCARRANVLRTWLHGQLGVGAPQTLVDRLLAEAIGVGPARWPAPGAVVQRRRGWLTVQRDGDATATTGARQRDS